MGQKGMGLHVVAVCALFVEASLGFQGPAHVSTGTAPHGARSGQQRRVLGAALRGGVSSVDLSMRYPGEGSAATILLVRHGQTEWNVQGRYQGQKDSPLTLLGRQEATALGERLLHAGRDIDAIWSSDLPRASDTARHVVDELRQSGRQYDVRLDPRLRERSFGILEGLTREECRRLHPDEIRKFSADGGYAISGGGESRSTLVQRAEEALVNIAKQSLGQTSLVVTHGAVVSSLMRHLLGIPFNAEPGTRPLADLQIRNTCICELKYYENGRWTVLSMGDTAHTEPLKSLPPKNVAPDEARSIEQA